MDLSRRGAELVTRSPRAVLAVAFACTLAAALLASQVRIEVDLLSVFDPQGPDRELADEFGRAFDSDQATLVAVVETVDDRPLSEAAVTAIAELGERAATIDGVTRVASITTTGVVRPPGLGDPEQFYAPAFAPDLDQLPLQARIDLARNGRLGTRELVSEDGTALLVVGVLDAGLATLDQRLPTAERFRNELRAVAATHADVVTIDFAGLQFTNIETVERTRADLILLVPLLITIMLVLTLAYFRRVWAMVAMLAAVVPSVLMTLAVMWMLGDDLNQFTTAFPVLLIGMTVATGTHLVHRFFSLQAEGASIEQAAWGTVRSVSGVSLLCAATNAIGFLSLLVASMPVLREFGLYLAIGVLFSFAFTALVIPAVLGLARVAPPARYSRSPQPRPLARSDDGKFLPRHRQGAAAPNKTGRAPNPSHRWTTAYGQLVARPPVALALSGLGLLMLVGGLSISRGAVFDYTVSRGFPSDSTISDANATIDGELSGSIPVEISLRGQPGTWLQPDNLQRLQDFDRFLIDEEGLYSVGVPSIIAELEVLGIPVPTSEPEIASLISSLTAEDVDAQAIVDRVLTEDRSWTRLAALRPEDGTNAYLAMVERIEAEAASVFAGTSVNVRVTGNAAVTFRGVDQLTGELMGALSLAVLLIVAAIALSFRSAAVAAVTLLPNALPLAAGFGCYLLLFDKADPLMAGVFIIVLGIAADDTVHLTNRYLSLIGDGVAPRVAVVRAFVDLRPAMVSSTMVLVSAFVALTTASMPSTQVIGWLGGGILLLALLSDLVFGTAGISLLAAWHERRGVTLRDRRLAISPVTDRLPPPRPTDSRPLLVRQHVLLGLSIASIVLFATGAILVLGDGLDTARLSAFGLFAATGIGLFVAAVSRRPARSLPPTPRSN